MIIASLVQYGFWPIHSPSPALPPTPTMNMATEVSNASALRNNGGALIFWAYIAAALFLMAAISTSAYDLWIRTPHRSSRRGGGAAIGAYVALAIVSFATLSYNMLNVLILEHSKWLHHSSSAHQMSLLPQLWIWSVESSLFVSFAEEITASPARWFWSQAELGISMVVSCWMGIEGRRGTQEHPVPKLWAYFALLQILPTSIVVNLFILTRLATPARIRPTSSLSKQRVLPNKPSLWLSAIIMYFGCLIQAGRNVYDGRNLIKLVLMGRSMLLAPLVLGVRRVATDNVEKPGIRVSEGTSTILICVTSTAALSILQWFRLRETTQGRSNLDVLPTLLELWRVKDEHPAVASLSVDCMQGVVSLLLWLVVHID